MRQDLASLPPEAQELLDLHNQYRDEVQIPRLTWSDELANNAQSWANELASSGGQLRHPDGLGGSGMGENLWGGTARAFSLDQMINSWGSEKRFFRNGRFPNISSTGDWEDVGHYSQMVWRNTTQLGCGLATGSGVDILVCRYSPPGNFSGQQVF
ncbi:SCP-like extracellular [Leptolyngbyaceae cyanobacterium CCMR0081]|uniref:SCP-like extracellular n=1 Tax=Adonisia turfae CCMR0081 TaxID=2292702 RepID=A0A6M0RET9_9CYAN|nr:SCP-like extracellular [Adonisia turfae CCMR0081]